MDNNKVVLGLSAGIDSTASAVILKERGYDVYALYFDVLEKRSEDVIKRAETVCEKLNIHFRYLNIADLFEKTIIEPFCNDYVSGRTPLPCMLCNPFIKWKVLRDYADELGAQWLASGHYAGVTEIDDAIFINRSTNVVKDQSYMLAGLDQSFLKRIIFPLTGFTSKNDVRKFLVSKGFEYAEEMSESQDICFISGDYRDFLKERNIKSKPGNFLDEDGNVIGRHNAHTDFTIGQGKGFGMGFNKKVYVKKIDAETGDITLCSNETLFEKELKVRIFNFAKYGKTEKLPAEYEGKDFDVKIRYAAKPAKAKITSAEDGYINISFYEAQRGPTPGQYAVFYENDMVIGAGIIE